MVGLFKQPKRRLKKLIRDGEYVDAITFGKNLESDYSDDSDFMFIMGSIYFIVDDAIDCCYRILKIDPKNSEAQDLIKELECI